MTLLNRFRAGDPQAASGLFGRYYARLRGLIRGGLSPQVARRVDPEDLVQSVYLSFFRGASAGRYVLSRGGDLWRLLAGIARHKLLRQVRSQKAARRSVACEVGLDLIDEARQPQEPPTIVEWTDQLRWLNHQLNPFDQRVLELRLQECQIAEIATATGRSERSVRRSLARVRDLMGEPVTANPGRLADLPLQSDREFTLHRMIGSGGMGKVYAATIRVTNQPVAVKFLRRPLLVRTEVVQRFLSEAQTISRLHHPRIVGLKGVGQTAGGSWFVVMDLVNGPSLAEVFQTRVVTQAEVVGWAVELCEGLEHAHDQGVGHCDLKPANLLLESDGSLRVTDFGLARSLDAATPRAARLEGTAPFMAPEQVSDRWGPIDQRTDVYGVGAVLFTLLAGRPPLVGRHVADILVQVRSATPIINLASLRPDLARPLADICQRCLSKLPSARFASVRDLRQALREVEGSGG